MRALDLRSIEQCRNHQRQRTEEDEEAGAARLDRLEQARGDENDDREAQIEELVLKEMKRVEAQPLRHWWARRHADQHARRHQKQHRAQQQPVDGEPPGSE